MPYDDHNLVAMEKRDTGYYQVEVRRRCRRGAMHSIDIIIGSGNIGQSYLYWMQNQLFQLPVSYFGPADKWSNSPAFPNRAVFSRFITTRCLGMPQQFCQRQYRRLISTPRNLILPR
jgi:hypothetical protein